MVFRSCLILIQQGLNIVQESRWNEDSSNIMDREPKLRACEGTRRCEHSQTKAPSTDRRAANSPQLVDPAVGSFRNAKNTEDKIPDTRQDAVIAEDEL